MVEPMAHGVPPATLRLDKALWYLRLARTRSAAQALVMGGRIRMDGARVERCSAALRAGALLVLPGTPRIRVLRILALPMRRGPAGEAAACYRDLAIESEDCASDA
ncbi:MAG: S4 domain-containing protein [Sphingopyxis sp.]